LPDAAKDAEVSDADHDALIAAAVVPEPEPVNEENR